MTTAAVIQCTGKKHSSTTSTSSVPLPCQYLTSNTFLLISVALYFQVVCEKKNGATAAKECTFPGMQDTQCAPRVFFRVRCAQNIEYASVLHSRSINSMAYPPRHTTVLDRTLLSWYFTGTVLVPVLLRMLYWHCTGTGTGTGTGTVLYRCYTGTALITVRVLYWYNCTGNWYCPGTTGTVLLLYTGTVQVLCGYCPGTIRVLSLYYIRVLPWCYEYVVVLSWYYTGTALVLLSRCCPGMHYPGAAVLIRY